MKIKINNILKLTTISMVLLLNHANAHAVDNHRQLPSVSTEPPSIAKYPYFHHWHDEFVIDNYHWLTEDDNRGLVDEIIQQENRHTYAQLNSQKANISQMFAQMQQRANQQSQSNFWQDGDYFIKQSFAKNARLADIYYQSKQQTTWQPLWLAPQRKQQLNVNYYHHTTPKISPDGRYVAVAEDTIGAESYHIIIKDLQTNTIIATIENTQGNFVWHNANQLIYVRQHTAHQSDSVYLHTLGEVDDKLLFKETNGFYINVDKASSGKFSFIIANSQNTSEVWVVATDGDNKNTAKLIKPRQTNVEYYPEHYQNHFYIRSNHQGNFALYQSKKLDDDWQRLFLPTKGEFESFSLFGDWVIYKIRQGDVSQIAYAKISQPNQLQWIDFVDKNYLVWLSSSGFLLNQDTISQQPNVLRLGYSSLTTPKTVLSYDLAKAKFIQPTNKKSDNPYVSERLFAIAKDGTQIPISLVYKKSLKKADMPLLVYGYGAYGYRLEPTYGNGYVSLLDKGFAYALAHVRGGGELGETWHKQGTKQQKTNSIDDFVAVTKHLQQQGFGAKHNTFAMGESAGGLLVANACLQQPSLYRGCVLSVPLVDVLPSLFANQQQSEYDEWGNPQQFVDYQAIKKFSPYEQIQSKNYPAFFIMANQHDSRTSPWSALKFTAKLREYQQADVPILFMLQDGGHRGAMGRYSRLHNQSQAYGFMLHLLGKNKVN